jgi:DNA-binding response OmpR family regulator
VPPPSSQELRPARILIVEDDSGVRRVLTRALVDAGYDVVAMEDGQAGWDAARTADAPYHLVVTNNRMPHMSGTELVGHLREQFPGIPVLHLDDLSHPRPSALPADVPSLYKPFSVARLVDEVGRLLASR